MINLKDALENFSHDNDWDDLLIGAKIIDIWTKLQGEGIAEVAKILTFEDGCLFLKARSSSWKTEITLRKSELMKSINEELDRDCVKDIKVRS